MAREGLDWCALDLGGLFGCVRNSEEHGEQWICRRGFRAWEKAISKLWGKWEFGCDFHLPFLTIYMSRVAYVCIYYSIFLC